MIIMFLLLFKHIHIETIRYLNERININLQSELLFARPIRLKNKSDQSDWRISTAESAYGFFFVLAVSLQTVMHVMFVSHPSPLNGSILYGTAAVLLVERCWKALKETQKVTQAVQDGGRDNVIVSAQIHSEVLFIFTGCSKITVFCTLRTTECYSPSCINILHYKQTRLGKKEKRFILIKDNRTLILLFIIPIRYF